MPIVKFIDPELGAGAGSVLRRYGLACRPIPRDPGMETLNGTKAALVSDEVLPATKAGAKKEMSRRYDQ
jgi:hypothetical protein